MITVQPHKMLIKIHIYNWQRLKKKTIIGNKVWGNRHICRILHRILYLRENTDWCTWTKFIKFNVHTSFT